jgi:CheY-like chemotaxis protein
MSGNLSDAAALPGIILLDINMPRLDGWRFLAEYGKIAADSAKKIMIYVLSSSIADGDRARALREPLVTDFITKPLEADKFAEICRAFYSNNAG